MRLSIADIGSTAQRLLGASRCAQPVAGLADGLAWGSKGSVIAEFSRCCYVCLPDNNQSLNSPADNCLCIGHPDILPGPINLLFNSAAHWNTFKSQLTKDAVVTFSKNRLALGSALGEFSDARFSNNTVRPVNPDLDVLCIQDNMLRLCEVAPAYSVASILFRPQSHQRIAKRTALQQSFIDYMLPACTTLGHSLQDLLNRSNLVKNYQFEDDQLEAKLTADTANAAIAVLGAGSGLTPAGDDLVAGILLGLRYYGFTEQSQQIMNTLAPAFPTATHVISSALLQQAASGKAGQAMLDVLHSLNTSSAIETTPVALLLDQQGHTSGWDCFAGLALLTQAVTQQLPTESFTHKVEYQC